MDILRSAIESLFLRCDFQQALSKLNEGKRPDVEIDKQEFARAFQNINDSYGSNVVQELSSLVCGDWTKEGRFVSVYLLLTRATDEMLGYSNGELYCRFEHYLRWNELTSKVGEDLLTIAKMAHLTAGSNNKNISMSWKPVLTTNDFMLNDLLRKGLTEQHAHLKATSTLFDLNWLSLMNYKPEKSDKFHSEDPFFFDKIMVAESIRITLFIKAFYPLSYNLKEIENQLKKVLHAQSVKEREVYMDYFWRLIKEVAFEQGKSIAGKIPDYALPKLLTPLDAQRYFNFYMVGERQLVYHYLSSLFSTKRTTEDHSLLYLYLLAKNKVRCLFIQNDHRKGFSHFQEFDHRKEGFLKDDIYTQLLPFLAVHNTIGNQSIRKLELRITPKESKSLLVDAIQKLNKCITNPAFRFAESSFPNITSNGIIKECDCQIGYIVHFIKRKEKSSPNKDIITDYFQCRNHDLRRSLYKQAFAIANTLKSQKVFMYHFGEKQQEKNIKLIGVDAAGSEFDSRPEVFGPVYRFLKQTYRTMSLEDDRFQAHSFLGFTYHVGEDFYDIVDGLRAIDEALRFLNLEKGDRIGHGVALGINAKTYYDTRHNTIVLPKQVLLDNIVWILHNIHIIGINDCQDFEQRLIIKFHSLFSEIYGSDTEGEMAFEFIDNNIYYESWLLRGDDPSLYKTGQFVDSEMFFPYLHNRFDEEIIHAGKNTMAKELYYRYHFNSIVKTKGLQMTEFHFEPTDVEIIEKLQLRMCEKISRCGIIVEMNPTSNLRITDISRYIDHPILKMDRNDLVSDTHRDMASQMLVTINTDDQGIFATSLEKEYTLMAAALSKDKKNSEHSILRWLNHIRETADVTSFLK